MRKLTRSGLALALISASSMGCERPFNDENSATVLTDLRAEPQFIRANVPLAFSFRALGVAPSKVSYELANERGECEPTRIEDRYRCQHPGLGNKLIEGPSQLAVEIRDDQGRTSRVTTPIAIDFQCPRFISLTVMPEIAQPGDVVVVRIQANEELGEPPLVSYVDQPWERAVGEGESFSVTHQVTMEDPPSIQPIRVRLSDRAGNTSTDCGGDGQLSFAVDQTGPRIDSTKIAIFREAPGAPSTMTASASAFLDDVGVTGVRVLDDTGTRTLALLRPEPDGSIPTTNLGVQPSSRVILEAIDSFGRKSSGIAVPERWRLSIGSGSTPKSGIRIDSRRNLAPPRSGFMKNRTIAAAPEVFATDARAATVHTRIAFEKVGELPARYEDVNHIVAGYDPAGKTIVAAGGNRGSEFGFFANYVADVLLISWDENEGAYVYEQAPSLMPSLRDQIGAPVPGPRYGGNIAFDGQGCGVMFGGDVLYLRPGGKDLDAAFLADVWRICYTGNGYTWTHVPLPDTIDDTYLGRVAPIAYDPINRRYVVAGGSYDLPVLFIETGPDLSNWRLVPAQPLPSEFVSRSQGLLFWDPLLGGFAHGLGFHATGNGEQLQLWSHVAGQWTFSDIPRGLAFRAMFGADYDRARDQLVIWGGNSDGSDWPPEATAWFLTKTSTHGADAWRSAVLDHPVPRIWPSLVYDSDREVSVVFGGVRPSDGRFIPPDIHQLIAEPSSPHLQASIDLAAKRPKGIGRLHLDLRAAGSGDGDGTGPGTALAGGVVVSLYDHERGSWIEVARNTAAPNVFAAIEVDIRDRPERFVSPDGTVPLTITTSHPATEALSARLDVDQIDGHLTLDPGVMLP